MGAALSALAVLVALHGWGRLVAFAVRDEAVDAALATAWGVAAVIALGGMMLAAACFEPQPLVVVGLVAHALWMIVRWRSWWPVRWGGVRFWLVPAVIAAVVVVIHALAAAGQVTARPFDDEMNVIEQVRRLVATGSLRDPVGFPRLTQLGGHVTLGSLMTVFGDAQWARVFDRAVGLALLLWLACRQLRPRDASTAIWATLIVVLVAAFRPATTDLLPFWTCAALVLALHLTIERAPRTVGGAVTIAVVAGGMCALRNELIPVAVAQLAMAWWADRRDARRAAVLVLVPIVVLAGYVIARHTARAAVPDAVLAHLAKQWPLLVRVAVFAAVLGVTVPLARLLAREVEHASLQRLAISIAAGIAGISSRLTGLPPSSSQLLWALALAGVAAIAIALANDVTLHRIALVTAALVGITAFASQYPTSGKPWSRRYRELLVDARFARDWCSPTAAYDGMLAMAPPGASVALWVLRPELIADTSHRLIDLRTPRIARARTADAIVRALRSRYVLVEDDADAVLANSIAAGRIVAARDGLRLIDLGR